MTVAGNPTMNDFYPTTAIMKTARYKILTISIMLAGCVVLIAWFVFIRPAARANFLLNAYHRSARCDRCAIQNPCDQTIFPPELPPPTFRWHDSSSIADAWLVSFRFDGTRHRMHSVTDRQSWTPSKKQWETLKGWSRERRARVTVIGLRGRNGRHAVSGGEVAFSTSKDSVLNPLFYREVILPFSDAVKDPSLIRWKFGTIDGLEQPRTVLENLPVCGNCHSFSSDGKTLGMDVDYANDKGAYAVTGISRDVNLVKNDIITWSDFERNENDPTFGLLSQVSPDGRFVISTVKDRSVFVPKPDLAFSQLFFPIQGILAIYSRTTGTFSALHGADDPALVQSNPSWSPDGKYIVFARSTVYRLKALSDKSKVVLSPEECSEFLTSRTTFKFDLYRIPFNGGKGGIAEPLKGASGNGMSNFFARYSPDGRWIVFCKANSFMLLQPDSRLYIMPAEGGEPRPMRCNTGRMNSWHTWSSNSRWLVFASKQNTPYTQLFITHIDSAGNDAPPVCLERLTASDRAANIPEFVYCDPRAIDKIHTDFIDDVSLWRAGMAFEEAGDTANAFPRFIQALKMNPGNVKAHISVGNILEARGNTDEAIAHYLRAVELDSNDAIARINVGNILLNRGNAAEAITHYSAALRLAPENGYAEYNLAQAYFNLMNYHQARTHFLAALRLMPGDALTLFALGKTYSLTGNREDAIAYLTKGVASLPDDPDGYQLLADELVRAGRTTVAVRQYRKGLSVLPGNATLRFHLANLLRKQNAAKEALRLYEEALQLRPGFKDARDSLATLAQ
jgi:tetratricopeptide (TPR) repeat protein